VGHGESVTSVWRLESGHRKIRKLPGHAAEHTNPGLGVNLEHWGKVFRPMGKM
jgi:hypothetical protein